MTDDNPDQIDSDEEIEEKYADGGADSPSASENPQYTVILNGKQYALNKQAREAIQTRAENEYRENPMFTCFWKVAHPDQYDDEAWDDAIHDAGDTVLVIETEGPMVPWERMDKLDVEMQEVGPESQFDGAGSDSDRNDIDNGNGLKMVPPDDDDDVEKQIGRTHFGITPQSFEEVPSPDGEDPNKVPPKPQEMGDEPVMVKWIPDHPEIEHSWSAGEAICPMFNRVEWNVQKKANQPRISLDKDDSHDLWESMLKLHDCEVVAELQPSQDVPPSDEDEVTDEVPDDAPDHFEEGRANGNNWRV